MASVTDLLQVKQIMTRADGDEVLNIFHYNSLLPVQTGDDLLRELGDAFALVIPPALQAILHSSVVITSLEVTHLYDPALLYEKPMSLAGGNTVEIAPGFTAISFRTTRVRRDIRRGQKRFGPISESQTLDGKIQSPGGAGYVAIEDALGAQLLSADTGDIFNPVIIGRIAYITPSGKTAYRLPINPTEARAFHAENWNIANLTTQNTRKNRA